MPADVKTGFSDRGIVLPLSCIVPQHEVTPFLRRTAIYKQIAASIRSVGLIEPLAVYPRAPNDYLLLDGHLRLDILKSMDIGEVRVILATDDEAYTYNKRVNQAPPIAQHFMILKAIASGVDEESIARALNLDIASIRRKRDMLEGICPEAVDLLRTTQVPADTFAVLKKMRPIRQIETAEHMLATRIFSGRFAKSLLAVTRPELLVEQQNVKRDGAGSASIAGLEEEAENLVRDLKAVEASYGTDMLTLTVLTGYLGRLLDNSRVQRYMSKHHAGILQTISSILTEVKPADRNGVARSA